MPRKSLNIGSATPAALPIMLSLISSPTFRERFSVNEMKVWRETEKHLVWIVRGKADLMFTSVLTLPRLISRGYRMVSVLIWDNFYLISLDNAKALEELRGKEIYLPLFKAAPPAKVTEFLIKLSRLRLEDSKLRFGSPFGRPEEISRMLIEGRIRNGLLREPEASFTIYELNRLGKEFSVLSYEDIWNALMPGFGSFPNAGLLVKEELLKDDRENIAVLVELMDELIKEVKGKPKNLIKELSSIMNRPEQSVELFLERVKLRNVRGKKLISEMKRFFEVLTDAEIIEGLSEKLLQLFEEL